MATTYLNKAGGTATDRRIFTLSFWIKRSLLNTSMYFYETYNSGNPSDDRFFIAISAGDNLRVINFNTGTADCEIVTNRVLRDVSAWYHIVVAIDTKQATASDRVKIYINGELETSFSTNSPFAQDAYPESQGTSYPTNIGRYNGSTAYFDGSMSHFNFIDGTQYSASDFGETDATTGEWKIKTSPSVTYGNNGFFILKDGNSVTDQSGNSNNFTVGGGTLTKTEDCPSNVFCTMNPLNAIYISFLQGNNTISGGNNGTDYSYIGSTLAANSGKFYWEVKAADLAEIDQVGIAKSELCNFSGRSSTEGLQGTLYGGKGFQFSNGNKVGDGSQSAYMGGFSEDDIAMIALDLDNNKITFGRNGQWSNGSGGADQTYANSTPAYTNLTAGETYMPTHAMRGSGGNTGISRYNFGNGYFATTAVSSAGTNASGIGIFEYDVPTGFTALSTKGLNL